MDTGYQAYSLLKAGKDYFGNKLPLFFHSLADYRTPVFIYANVPSVTFFGLNVFSVRIWSAVLGVLGVALMYILAGPWAALVLALSPWHVQYSRQSVETLTMMTMVLLGFVLFRKNKLNLAALFFGLATASYSPAKLFVPLFITSLVFFYKRISWKFILIFSLVFFPIVLDNFIGKSGMRFHDLSIFTDPTSATEIDWKRKIFAISTRAHEEVGIAPGLFEKIIYNKPGDILVRIFSNYVQTFSTDFLFLRGDQELRHSPNKEAIGMLHLVEIVPFIIGLYLLTKIKEGKIIVAWLLLAPIPAALTRDGGTHAARLLIILPALVMIIGLGIKKIKWFYIPVWILSSMSIFGYFFTTYRWESAAPFQYGFDKVINLALNNQSRYSKIFIDGKEDTLLMAYLFYTKTLSPSFANPKIYSDWEAHIFNNIYLMRPGSKDWPGYFQSVKPSGKELYIISARENGFKQDANTIYYPDRFTPAFYVVER